MANDEFSKFGSYNSNKTHNQNKKNTGYNNSLNEGLNFSTTLGANFSTVAGGNFSTTGGLTMSTVVGLNMPVTIGGKVELIGPYSIKWTRRIPGTKDQELPQPAKKTMPDSNRRGYDYDFKNCQTQVKWNEGNDIYTVNSPNLHEWKGAPTGEMTDIVEKKKDFAKLADVWLGEQTFVSQSVIKKILQGDMKYGTVTTTVDKECKITAGALKSTCLILVGNQAKLYSLYNVVLEGNTSVCLKTKGTATVNGSIIKVG